MNVIFLIARDSIRALLHQRLLLALIMVSLAMTVVSTILMNLERRQINAQFLDDDQVYSKSPTFKNMSEEDKRKMQEAMEQGMSTLEAFLYAAGSFGGSLVSLFIFSTAVTSEIRRGTIRLTLSKPISRIQYLLGKYLGGMVVMAAYAIIASLAMVLSSRVVARGFVSGHEMGSVADVLPSIDAGFPGHVTLTFHAPCYRRRFGVLCG